MNTENTLNLRGQRKRTRLKGNRTVWTPLHDKCSPTWFSTSNMRVTLQRTRSTSGAPDKSLQHEFRALGSTLQGGHHILNPQLAQARTYTLLQLPCPLQSLALEHKQSMVTQEIIIFTSATTFTSSLLTPLPPPAQEHKLSLQGEQQQQEPQFVSSTSGML
ncbi:hypothetical protein FGO68_gene13284 [Halteria grandinella]|uniref:Uncharacterized protein n=1 Tax=Halteria grandinella TaxID=5974 RepID=A0A8J8NJY3_HALGN|nr:hypothetical protein FGO68_gene13284 [Halteria grandinella]